MSDHAAMAPSSAEMWMNCPASITKAAGRTRPSSVYAREGTAAHAIAEKIINGDMFPPGKITVEGQEFIVGLPMLRALNPYIAQVQDLQGLGAEVHIEKRVAFNNEVWGTTDCAARFHNNLRIIDLKYGMGVPVSPDSNQLKIYAVSAATTLWPGRGFERVYLTVHQPRIDPMPKTHTVTARELADWRDGELKPAILRIRQGDETEKTGTYCRWCVRKSECKTFKSYKNSMAADIFDDGVDTLNT